MTESDPFETLPQMDRCTAVRRSRCSVELSVSGTSGAGQGTGAQAMKAIRVVGRIATGLLVVAFVCLLLTFFVPVEPWREATGTTYLWATYAFLVMLAANLLVTAVEGLWRWISGRKHRA